MNEMLNSIGVIVALVISVASFVINVMRSRHQNSADDGGYLRNMAETTSLMSKARLDSEIRETELEKRITDLERMLEDMAYRVTFVVHTGEDPKIETISVERFRYQRRTHNEPVVVERRKEDQP